MSEWIKKLARKHNKRILQDGSVANDLSSAVTLSVYTKCPEKYKLVDMETGEVYIGQDPVTGKSWKKYEQ